MPQKCPIDERDVDELLASLTNRQIADLFAMTEESVAQLRRQRRAAKSCGCGGLVDRSGTSGTEK